MLIEAMVRWFLLEGIPAWMLGATVAFLAGIIQMCYRYARGREY